MIPASRLAQATLRTAAVTALAFAPVPAAHADGALQKLTDAARAAAAEPYTGVAAQDKPPLPGGLSDLKYDGHRDIRNPPARFLWAATDLPFRLQFKHLGWLFPDPVALSEVEGDDDQIVPIPFDPARFTYGKVARQTIDPAALPDDLGYAGLSLHHVATPDGAAGEFYNEILSIQGGSYFRAVGTGQHWGASVRAAAIDTAIPDIPEEFPRWTQLWAKRPAPGDTTVTLYGLMEGPSIAGAYRLVVTPGETLTIDVDATIFMRHGVTKLGLAPITSMYLFAEENPAAFGDYRPEVHDSDGLSIVHEDGTQTWRPLHNPFGLSVTDFPANNVRGFGLLQRDRDFKSYEDLETEMQLRPSIFVTPKGDWGPGHIELVEFGSKLEATDNIGAFWVPDSAANGDTFNVAGGEFTYGYRLDFTQEPRPTVRSRQADEDAGPPALLRFAATRTAPAHAHGNEDGDANRREHGPVRFIVDTTPGHTLPNGTPVLAKVTVSGGQLVAKPFTQYNRFEDAYRVFFDVLPDGPAPLDLTLTLRGEDVDPETGESVPDPEFDPSDPTGQLKKEAADAARAADPNAVPAALIPGPALSETWHYRWERPSRP